MRLLRGFTLIELMVTIVVLAIIAAMAAPSFSRMILRQNLNKSTRELAIALSDARVDAILHRNSVEVDLGSTSKNWLPVGKTVLISKVNNITFGQDGLIQDPNNTNQVLPQDEILVLCDQEQSKAMYSQAITLSRLGTIQQGVLVEGGCHAN
ncbi:prepilin-type N-terminal cleavage/methylation domain-containing protein [Acinetobacter sp. MD2]|uniref:pilus assembly FimT family protein n=1 Tax=Acinetobacter sp. MD2 TaxID=2600066 RepID=UPI002D1F1E99|nr:prepilin-type N-terminal cleavage/methylation domain-containing protein [Acinetobacter sp. MD2]MEB3767237.1 prepilin-type N-terminal cleavage/methylation domain-containing protein [Acinetobacter sp. MD2]